MGIYYMSIFSKIVLGVTYALLAVAFLIIVRITRGWPWRKTSLAIVFVILLVLPFGEELWISWNFEQACKEAGTFIHKKVKVEGFYDNTSAGSLDLVRSGAYRFVEGRNDKGPIRLTLGNASLIKEAFAQFEKENPGKDPSTQDIVRVKLEDNVEALVFPKKGDSWRITTLDRPTARYWFGIESGIKVAHKVGKEQSIVTDMQANEVIARYVRIHRTAPWYFIGLGVGSPILSCDSPDGGPHSKHSALIYREVLLPIGSTSGGSK